MRPTRQCALRCSEVRRNKIHARWRGCHSWYFRSCVRACGSTTNSSGHNFSTCSEELVLENLIPPSNALRLSSAAGRQLYHLGPVRTSAKSFTIGWRRCLFFRRCRKLTKTAWPPWKVHSKCPRKLGMEARAAADHRFHNFRFDKVCISTTGGRPDRSSLPCSNW